MALLLNDSLYCWELNLGKLKIQANSISMHWEFTVYQALLEIFQFNDSISPV